MRPALAKRKSNQYTVLTMRVLVPAARIYAVLLAIALLWMLVQKRLSWQLFLGSQVDDYPRLALMTLGASGFLITLSLYCSRNFQWAQQLEEQFCRVLVPLRLWEIAALGILSGVAEETFFRGAVQPVFGLIPASLAFGLAHFIPRHPFWHWSLYAAFAGFVLGCLVELTHHLLPAITAHSMTNFVLIVVLNRRHSMQPVR
jgi:membrane protease YdiL (CAAX protease family)